MGTKKGFSNIGNVVEQFISATPEAKAEPEEQPKARPTEAHPTRLADNDRERAKMARQAEANAALVAKRPQLRREKPSYGETRSQRVQLLVKPSIYSALQAIADRGNISFNQVAERAFMEYVDGHAEEE